MANYKHLFQPVTIGGIRLKNRIIMAPMNTAYMNNDGTLSNQAYAYYLERARGGVGMIIVEASAVDWPMHKGGKRQPRFNSKTVTPEWRLLTDSVHAFGTKIIAQVNHNGCMASPNNNDVLDNVTASEDTIFAKTNPARALTKEEIQAYVQKYTFVSEMIQASGFDGMEIHAAHATLHNQFLSPLTNHRNDEYGGNLENRCRFLIDVITSIRKARGDHFLISVRFPSQDKIAGGLTLEDGKEIAKLLEKAGVDLINCSTGFTTDQGDVTELEFAPEGARIHYAKAMKEVVTTAKVATVGKLRTPAMCDQIIADGTADVVCLARPLVCDPQWPNKVKFDREKEIRPCLSCIEGCLLPAYGGQTRCVLNPFAGSEFLYCANPALAPISKKVVIVGGGLSGLQAAIIAKKRGHHVIILEKAPVLGGQMILAGKPPGKEAVHRALNWFIEECQRQKIEIHLNVEADAAIIADYHPEVVINATGSLPWRPPIEGINNAVDAWEILKNSDNLPKNKEIVLIGGGTVGCETAELLLQAGNQITILEMAADFCRGQEANHKAHLLQNLQNGGVRLITNANVNKINEQSVTYLNAEKESVTIPCQLVIVATGQRSCSAEWSNTLEEQGIPVYSIGDALQFGNFRSATRSAMEVVYNI